MSFKNKIVIVTGGGSGIGKATVLKLNNEGARIALVGRSVEKLYEVAAHCFDALVIQADIKEDKDCERIINTTIAQYGQLDLLVNNAGTLPLGSLFNGKILEAYEVAMREKVRAVVYLTTLAIPHLIKTKGNIINISGVGGHIVPLTSDMIMFYTAEAAMNHFTKCSASELAPYGVRVNAISPGPVNTSIFNTNGMKFTLEDVKNLTPLGRVSEPDEIADLILYVGSHKARSITGSIYVIDNGYLLK